jgi:hypothetical protein
MRTLTFSLTSPLEGFECLCHAPATSPRERDPVPIIQEAGLFPGPVWMGAENLIPIGVRSPDHPALSESLYRLSSPGQFVTWTIKLIEIVHTSYILHLTSQRTQFVSIIKINRLIFFREMMAVLSFMENKFILLKIQRLFKILRHF